MLSPIDEYQYIGDCASVADEGGVRQGTAMSFFARKYIACGSGPSQRSRAITQHAAPDSITWPIAGGTPADLYPPPYFWSIRALAQP